MDMYVCKKKNSFYVSVRVCCFLCGTCTYTSIISRVVCRQNIHNHTRTVRLIAQIYIYSAIKNSHRHTLVITYIRVSHLSRRHTPHVHAVVPAARSHEVRIEGTDNHACTCVILMYVYISKRIWALYCLGICDVNMFQRMCVHTFIHTCTHTLTLIHS
jgi:hypothetical protein